MLDKIILSEDRHSAIVHFDTHSFRFQSDQDVMTLVDEFILEPMRKHEERCRVANEDTVEIDLQLSFPTTEAA